MTDPLATIVVTCPITATAKPGKPLPNIVSVTVTGSFTVTQGGVRIAGGPLTGPPTGTDFGVAIAPALPAPTVTATITMGNTSSGLTSITAAGQTGILTITITATDANGQSGSNSATWQFTK